jgi:nucleotide-binding universal stress UspA family protein
VVEPRAPSEVHGERHLTDLDEAVAYLDNVAARAFRTGSAVKRHVHGSEVSSVASGIAEHIGELGSDLIVMCPHGRSGLRTWLLGNIAQQVLALGAAPILFVPLRGRERDGGLSIQCLLVPLDGTPDHEQGLWVAAELAQACNAGLHLMVVVHTLGTLGDVRAATARLLPGSASEMLDLAAKDAEAYLRRLVTQLQGQARVAGAAIRRGNPTRLIVRQAGMVHADIVVLATHGRFGTSAFWADSVAPRVSTRSHVPLLLVPVRRSEAGRPPCETSM